MSNKHLNSATTLLDGSYTPFGDISMASFTNASIVTKPEGRISTFDSHCGLKVIVGHKYSYIVVKGKNLPNIVTGCVHTGGYVLERLSYDGLNEESIHPLVLRFTTDSVINFDGERYSSSGSLRVTTMTANGKVNYFIIPPLSSMVSRCHISKGYDIDGEPTDAYNIKYTVPSTLDQESVTFNLHHNHRISPALSIKMVNTTTWGVIPYGGPYSDGVDLDCIRRVVFCAAPLLHRAHLFPGVQQTLLTIPQMMRNMTTGPGGKCIECEVVKQLNYAHDDLTKGGIYGWEVSNNFLQVHRDNWRTCLERSVLLYPCICCGEPRSPVLHINEGMVNDPSDDDDGSDEFMDKYYNNIN